MNERKYEAQHKDQEEKASDISNQMANVTTQRAVLMVLITLLLPVIANPEIPAEGDMKLMTTTLSAAGSLYGTNISAGSTNEISTKTFLNHSVTEFLVQYPNVFKVRVSTSNQFSLLDWERSDAGVVESTRRVSRMVRGEGWAGLALAWRDRAGLDWAGLVNNEAAELITLTIHRSSPEKRDPPRRNGVAHNRCQVQGRLDRRRTIQCDS